MRRPRSTTVDPRRPFGSMGMDSLMALEMRNRLETEMGMLLPATTLFDHPTITALAEHLLVASGLAARHAADDGLRLNETDEGALISFLNAVKEQPELDGESP